MKFVDSEAPGVALPAGITVVVTQGGSEVYSGTTDSSGDIAFAPANGVEYVATFSGGGAPSSPQTFFGGTSGYLTTESGSVLTDESGNPILTETPGTTIVICDGYTGVTPVSIAITPADATLSSDAATQQYVCTLTYSDSSTLDVTDSVTWTATGGTITSGGLYTHESGSPNTVSASYPISGGSPLTDSTSVSSPVNGAMVTQAVVEVISPILRPGLRITQTVAEIVRRNTPPGMHLTQMVAEVISQHIPARARLTQIVVEMLNPVTYTLEVSPPTANISTTARQQYTAYKVGSNGFRQPVPATWTTSDPYGSIDSTGLYTPTANSPGSHTITATELS